MAERAATRADVCGPLGTPGGVAPLLNAATDEQVAEALDTAALLVYPPRWRKLAHKAHAYLAAHILATTPGLELDGEGGDLVDVIGPLASESDGPAARSFAALGSSEAVPGSDADYLRTPYGQGYLRLRRAQRGFGSVLVSGGRFAP